MGAGDPSSTILIDAVLIDRLLLGSGRRSWGLGGLDPLKICRGSECVVTLPLKMSLFYSKVG